MSKIILVRVAFKDATATRYRPGELSFDLVPFSGRVRDAQRCRVIIATCRSRAKMLAILSVELHFRRIFSFFNFVSL